MRNTGKEKRVEISCTGAGKDSHCRDIPPLLWRSFRRQQLHSASQCCWKNLMKVAQWGVLEDLQTETTNVQLYQRTHKHGS